MKTRRKQLWTKKRGILFRKSVKPSTALPRKVTLILTKLTTPMIHEFVDKIVVHEADKSSGDRIQQIDIYLKYVGKLDVPIIYGQKQIQATIL